MSQSPPRRVRWLLGVGVAVAALAALWPVWLRVRDVLPVVSIPSPALPSPNAYDDYARAQSQIADASKAQDAIYLSGLPGEHVYTQAEKVALVRENALALRTLRQGLGHPYRHPPVRTLLDASPVDVHARQLARLLSLEEQARAGAGDWGGAANSSLDALRLGAQVPHGGGLIGAVVGISCQAIGRKPLWDIANHLDAAQARAAARRLHAIGLSRVPLADTLQEEEWAGQAEIMEMMRPRGWRGQLGSLSGGSWPLRSQAQTALTSSRAILENYTRTMDQAIRSARLPYAKRPLAPPAPADFVSQLFASSVWHPDSDYPFALKDTDNEAQNALLEVTLALRAYRLERRGYPESLAALVPNDLPAVPTDPFAPTGLIRYRLIPDGYVLYSVGPDGRDDGGTPAFDASRPGPAHPGASDPRYFAGACATGDLVAGVNRY